MPDTLHPDTLHRQSILVVAGMHRSGTSFAASLLQSAGINVGDRLLAGSKGNLKGHFEDVDFYEFHKAVLAAQNIDPSGWTLSSDINVPIQFLPSAQAMISERSGTRSVWGWKDPRTTLFLNFWANLLPEANFLLVYRSPWEVADSLFRRGAPEDQCFTEQASFAIDVWNHYNQKVLEFHQLFPERSVIVSVTSLIKKPEAVFSELRQRFSIPLVSPNSNLFDAGLLDVSASESYKPDLVSSYSSQVIHTYQLLQQQEANLFGWNYDDSWLNSLATFSKPELLIQDWMHACRTKDLSNQVKQLTAQCLASQAEISDLRQQLTTANASLAERQTELTTAQTSLQVAQTSLQVAQTSLQVTQTSLQVTQADLDRALAWGQELHVVVEYLKQVIVEMESSKFWKIKLSLQKIQHYFSRHSG